MKGAKTEKSLFSLVLDTDFSGYSFSLSRYRLKENKNSHP